VEMEKLYRSLPHGEAIFEEWKSRLVTLGQNVRVAVGETVLYGTAESVDKDGSLMLRDEDFNLIKIVAGDVTLSKT